MLLLVDIVPQPTPVLADTPLPRAGYQTMKSEMHSFKDPEKTLPATTGVRTLYYPSPSAVRAIYTHWHFSDPGN